MVGGVGLPSSGVQGVSGLDKSKEGTSNPRRCRVGRGVDKFRGNGLMHDTGEEFSEDDPGGLGVSLGENGIPWDCR